MRRYIIIFAVLTTIGGSVYFWFDQTHLLIKKTSPKSGGEATSIEQVVINFNHPITPDTAERFSIEPHVPGKVEIDGKTLRYTPQNTYRLSEKYTVKVERPESIKGLTGKDVELSFTVEYVETLSPDQQKQQLAQTDQVEKIFPITQYLPQETLDYKIDYRILTESEEPAGHNDEKESDEKTSLESPKPKLILEITLNAILNRADQRQMYEQQLRDYKKAALDFLRSKNANPADYTIEYDPQEATNF